SPYTINTEACIRCGSCREACRFDSVFTLGKEDLA
ncbi:MAG: 4Fe-4S binding protein, partial [Clostridium sp.]|nr:4Fe-4S binding protein [Clostridium sp.]